jgi:glycosyltransferase involved in cell wall biosynthesis
MKILVVESALRENGATRVVLDLAKRWNASGSPTSMFVLQRVTDITELRPAVPVRYGQPNAGRLRWSAPLVLARLLRAARPADVVVSVSALGPAVIAGAVVARLLRRPFVVIVHAGVQASVDAWVPSRLRRRTYAANRQADAVVCVSRGLVDSAIAAGIPPERITVILNGIDVNAIRARAHAPADAPLPRPLVVGVGRLTAQKGFDLLIQAHARVVRSGLDHHLMLVGEGPGRQDLEDLAERLDVASSVSFPGFLANPHAIVGRADLFCLSSRFEGFSLALLEALALNRPIVATNCVSGPAELLAGGRFGDLVEVGSVDALSDAIAAHLRAPERLTAMARGGSGQVRMFDPDAGAARYLDLFAALATRPRQPHRGFPRPARSPRE